MKITALAFLLLAAGACAQTSSGSGSNSNWASCTTDAQCSAIVAGAHCSSSGKCVAPPEGGSDGGVTCDDRSRAIGAQVNLAAADADRSCSVNADCTTIGLASRCSESCALEPVSNAGASAFASALAAIENSECDAFEAAGCTVIRSSCPPPAPQGLVCREGQCQRGTSADAGADAAPYSCEKQGDVGVVSDLDAYCRATGCAIGNLTDALDAYSCGPDEGTHLMTRTVGCGYETLAISTGYTFSARVFDATSGLQVGLRQGSDVPYGECGTLTYEVGLIPSACADTVVSGCDPVSSDAGPLEGCRAPDEPGCATCCAYDADGSVCWSYERRPGTNEYVTAFGTFGACDGACPPCARCSSAEEALLRANPPPAGCTCDMNPGIAPCSAPTSCECWCSSNAGLLDECAGVTP